MVWTISFAVSRSAERTGFCGTGGVVPAFTRSRFSRESVQFGRDHGNDAHRLIRASNSLASASASVCSSDSRSLGVGSNSNRRGASYLPPHPTITKPPFTNPVISFLLLGATIADQWTISPSIRFATTLSACTGARTNEQKLCVEP